jgi:hypothetical protein
MTALLGICVAVSSQALQQDDAAKNAQQARAALDLMVKALGGDAWLHMQNREYIGRTAAFYHGKPYNGKKPLPQEQVDDFLRRRDHSIETVVKQWLNDPKTILIYEGQHLAESHMADQVTLISAENEAVTIQMDSETHLPLRRSFQWRDPTYHDKNEDAEEYDNYRPVDGFETPYNITRFKNGDMVNQRFLFKAVYNQSLPADEFSPDAAAAKIVKK